jgi:hypothetical protein
MLPIMLFMIFYKVLWLLVVALPLWRAGTLAGSTAEMASVFVWVWVPVVAVPWGYVARSYLRFTGAVTPRSSRRNPSA